MRSTQPGVQLFAVEDTSAQLTWRTLGSGPVTIECGDFRAEFESDGGPGVCEIVGLAPDEVQTCRVTAPSQTKVIPFRTLAKPEGRELYRFATMSDLHLGRTSFGVRKQINEPGVEAGDLHPIRCAASATNQLVEWGAQRLIVKGDMVDANHDDNWASVERLVADLSIPWHLVPGNHELYHGHEQGDAFEMAARRGIDLIEHVEVIDVPGTRLILMNSAVVGKDIGRYAPRRDAVRDAAKATPKPVMLFTHHQPQSAPFPTYFPPAVGSLSASQFAGSLAGANRSVFASSGHTHRNRRRQVSGFPWTEVGSPKDYPGVWAGYVVHEGGIRQVVRRVSDPGCLVWLDRTRRAAGGSFGIWSPGRVYSRCFTHNWPKPRKSSLG